jgi:hypothetical protein
MSDVRPQVAAKQTWSKRPSPISIFEYMAQRDALNFVAR